MSKNQVTEIKTKALSVNLQPVDAQKTVMHIAAMLPPKLPEDMPLKSWLQAMKTAIGEHPQAVLDDARNAILSTKPFAPSPAEIIDAVLAAYKRLDLPLSEDAKRHLSYRKKTSARYMLNQDGVQRFAPDAKVTTIGYVAVSGVHVNMLLDENADATVPDVEAAVVSATAILQKREKTSIADILDETRKRLAVVMAHRIYGTPESYCGGSAGRVGDRALKLDFFAVSQAFVDKLRAMYPFAAPSYLGGQWDGAMREAFFRGAEVVTIENYGRGAQGEAENAVEQALIEMNGRGIDARSRELSVSLREVNRAIEILERTKWDDPRPLSVAAAGRSFLLHNPAEAESARVKIAADRDRITAEVGAIERAKVDLAAQIGEGRANG